MQTEFLLGEMKFTPENGQDSLYLAHLIMYVANAYITCDAEKKEGYDNRLRFDVYGFLEMQGGIFNVAVKQHRLPDGLEATEYFEEARKLLKDCVEAAQEGNIYPLADSIQSVLFNFEELSHMRLENARGWKKDDVVREGVVTHSECSVKISFAEQPE